MLPIVKSVRCHPRVHLHVQASGRWSTVEPPLATLPRDGSLDGLYVPDPGEAWVEYDLSQVELRLMAAEAGETRMLEAFREGRDLHTENTMVVFGWSSLPPVVSQSVARFRDHVTRVVNRFGVRVCLARMDRSVSTCVKFSEDSDLRASKKVSNSGEISTVSFARKLAYSPN